MPSLVVLMASPMYVNVSSSVLPMRNSWATLFITSASNLAVPA